MKLHAATFCFGGNVPHGGNPKWSTDLGEVRPDLKIIYPGADDVLKGMDYKSIPLYSVSCNLNKGGALHLGSESPTFRKASLFTEVFINDTPIGYPFALLLLSDQSQSWFGRLILKYSPKTIVYGNMVDGKPVYVQATQERYDGRHDILASNEEFFRRAYSALGLSPDACWFVYEINVINQNELHMSAVIVDRDNQVMYDSPIARKEAWEALIMPPESFSFNQFVHDVNVADVGLSYEPDFVNRFVSAILAKPFVVLSGLSGSGKTKLAQAFVRWISKQFEYEEYPFKKGGNISGPQSTYPILDVDRLGMICSQPGGGQSRTIIPFAIVEEWADYITKNPSVADLSASELASSLKDNYPTKFSGQIHSFHSLLKPMALELIKYGMEAKHGVTSLLVPVGADWTNSEKLLGYPNALDKTSYVMPDTGVLKLLLDAEKNPKLPFFLILDEMNLSHVERYFADFLSSMESGDEIKLYDGDQRYADVAKTIAVPRRVRVPKNLFVIGTMNVDETTYMFSPKVLDRAQVIEFRVKPDEMAKFVGFDNNGNWQAGTATKIDLDKLADPNGVGRGAKYAESFLELALSRGEKRPSDVVIPAAPAGQPANPDAGKVPVQEVAKAINAFFNPLEKLGAEFGYRSASEIMSFCGFYIDAGAKIDEAIDAAIVQKLLPKVHGSRRKLERVLSEIWKMCLKQGEANELDVVAKTDADYDFTTTKYPLSAEKVLRMFRAAMANGFASFAEA